jgi:hypothetical protein
VRRTRFFRADKGDNEIPTKTSVNLKETLARTDLSRREKLFAAMLFGGRNGYQVGEIKKLAFDAGLRQVSDWNVSEILHGGNGLVALTSEGWELQGAGKSLIQQKGVTLPHVNPHKATAAAELRAHLAQISNSDIRSFLEEAISCYETSNLRAAVVLSWVGAVAILHEYVVANKLAEFNAEAFRRDSKWKPATKADHLGLMSEDEFLDILASPAVGVLGKNTKEELKAGCLKLRNGCGHPNSLKIGETRVAAHIESLIQNVFSVFK